MGIIKKLRTWNINRKQASLKREMEFYGMSDELLEKQVALNIKRNKHDIPDERHMNDDGYVQ